MELWDLFDSERKPLGRTHVRGEAFGWVDYDTMAARYDPSKLTDGWNEVGGERIFYISNPALGLWDVKR